jgi:flagellar protein FlbD
MIWVTRLNGTEIVVNADLIETVESTPDTVVTLVDGKKYVVQESTRDLVARIQAYRASILALVDLAAGGNVPSDGSGRGEATLYVVRPVDEEV